MNNNVILFPTKNNNNISYENRQEYLSNCKKLLTEEDYRDILCGIMDAECYDMLDEDDLKNIVDTYFQNKC